MIKKQTFKTKQDYLTNYTQNPNLAEAVLKQIGEDWKTLKENIQDYQNASHGISGFIYYTDTHKFAKDHFTEIFSAIGDFQDETGTSFRGSQLSDLNFLAWFALETITHEIMYYLEEN